MATSNGGLSKERLERVHDVMAGYVERGEIPGLVTLVGRRGETYVDAIGTKTFGGGEPVARDTVFRISSMTKPITAVATLILVEDCTLRLDDPVDDLLPELADRQVLKRIDGPLDDTEPANRPITTRDLLTFTLGHGMLMAPPGTPIVDALAEIGLAPGPPEPSTTPTPDEWIRRLGTLPLLHQPGEQWLYNTGADVLGVLIARAAGRPFEGFLRERIFEPLGMHDTGFHVPADKLDRFLPAYSTNFETRETELFDEVDGHWSKPPALPLGGAGLVSTVDDFCAFGQMLLNHGALGGERVLARPSVETMTTDQLTPEQKAATTPIVPGYWESHGWGFGVSIVTRRVDPAAPVGKYGWDGGLGTSWYSDPSEEMVTILLTQRAWESPNPPPVCRDFWTCAYQAIDD